MHKLLILFVIPSFVFAKISANLPAFHPAYEMVDRLESWGCALTTFRATQPLSYSDLQASLVLPEGTECEAPEWLLKERDFFLSPRIPTQGSVSLLIHDDTLPLLGGESQVRALHPFHQGRPTYDGANLYGELSTHAEVGKDWGLAVSATPGVLFALDDFRFLNARFFLREGYIKVGYRRTELLFGRQALSFGNALHGSLALSEANKPFDLVKFSIRPHQWPSLLSYLGPTTFETWVASLGNSAFIEESKIWGIQLGFRPLTFLEFALLEMYQIGGQSIPSLAAGDILKMFFYSAEEDLQWKRRESFATHLAIWGPGHIFKFYQQFFANRLGRVEEWLSSDLGVLVGVWIPRIGKGDFRLEYTHTPPALYSNRLYRQGWSHDGNPVGSPLGSDAEGLYADMGLPPLNQYRPTLSLSYESRNKNPLQQGTATEWRYGVGGKIQKRWENTEWLLEVQQRYIANDHYISGQSRNTFSVFSSLHYTFL